MFLPSSKNTFEFLTTFKTIEEMNTALFHHKGKLLSKKHTNIRNVLQLISEHSCVDLGVSFLSQRKIAEKLNISYKTVQRAVEKLVSIGAIVCHASKRTTGDKRQSSNILVIQPIQEDKEKIAHNEQDIKKNEIKVSVQPEVSTQEADSINQNLKNTNDTSKSDFEKKEVIKKGLVIKLPETIQKSLAPFFDADKLYELSGIVFKAKASVDKNIRIEDHETEYYNAIISIINAFKRGKVRNFEGLLMSTIKATTRSIWLESRLSNMFGF